MMNIYRVDTTTNDEWEIIGGCYLVKAHNEVEAKEKVQKKLDEDGRSHEKICDKIINLSSPFEWENDVHFINDAQVE
jgi:hypothetical protein